ncbi:MAG: hypothetical protein HC882_04495 [Acidobacteria bacterium]|nr:hypothetical protein [Acidobacteriota bacterium]
MTAIAQNGGVTLNWNAVPGAANYTVFRGDLGCDRQHINVGTIGAPATTFFDDNVDPGFIAYYRVRPNGSNPACTGKVSNCIALPDEAKLIQNGFRIEDNVVGDNDGRVEPGETFRLPVKLFNYGTQDALQVIGDLVSGQADRVRVVAPVATWPSIAKNAALESNAPHFEVTVLPDANCGETLDFDLAARAQGGAATQGDLAISMGVFNRDYRNDTDVNVPNRTTTPVTSTITVTDVRTIQELDVSVDLSAFRTSDFVVEVRSPAGTTVRLHNQTSGSLNTRFDRDRQPDGPGTMAAFVGQPLNGTWTLSISDNVNGPFPTGSTLRSWALHATVNQPFDCTEFSCGDALPAQVPPTLLVTKSGADLVFDWDSATNADGYNVLASDEPTLAAPSVATRSTSGAVTTATGTGQASGPAGVVTFYEVRATNSCNWEGP